MDRTISMAEFVGRIPLSLAKKTGTDEKGELHATLLAHYEAAAREVVAELDSYVCPDDASHMMEERLRPSWLPQKQVVRAGGEAAESTDIARDIFHSWVRQVRDSVPGACAGNGFTAV